MITIGSNKVALVLLKIRTALMRVAGCKIKEKQEKLTIQPSA